MQPKNSTLRKLGVSLVAQRAGISEYRLNSNSLKILLAPDPTTRSVVVVQHIRVGSRHEGAGNTGYSHLLEHMLFKGTPTHNKAKGNSYDEYVKALGNICNATTSYDRTNFFAKIPSFALPGYLEHEADRLRNATIIDEDLATEMPVVVDEFDIGENDPDELLSKLLNAVAYTEHPYKVETIGSKSDVLNVTAQSLKDRLYNVYYWPNNTTLIIVGGLDEEETLRNIVRCYGSIPPSPHPIPTVYTVEPAQVGERRFVINKPGDLPRLGMAFHVPEADHEDHHALAALALILGGTPSSRLNRKLVDSGLCLEQGTGTYFPERHDPALFMVFAKLTGKATPQQVERIILREIARLQTRMVSKKELAFARKLNRNGTVMGRANRMRWALSLSEAEAAADWQWNVDYDECFEKVTREDILRVAKLYLTADNRTVGYFLPKQETAGEQAADTAAPTLQQSGSEETHAQAPVQPAAASAIEADEPQPVASVVEPVSRTTTATYAAQVRKTVLPNGLTVLLMPTPTETAIGFSLTVNAGMANAPADKRALPRMVAEMLTRGSARYSKRRINELASEMLVNYQWNPGTFCSRLNTHVPPADFPRFLDMVGDALRNPSFEASEVELLRSQLAAQLDEAESNPSTQSFVKLSQQLYTPDSPFFKKSTPVARENLRTITIDDLHAFHKSAYGPAGAVLALVGHFDVDAMLKLVTAKFGSWSGGQAPAQTSGSTLRAAAGGSRFNINIAGKDNLTIVVGLPSTLSMSSPDYAAAFLANQALGGDTLSSRLGYEIREKRGLTYGVYSMFSDDWFGGAPWMVQMTTNGKKLEGAIPLISQVLSSFVEDGITEKELATEKSALINALALRLDAPVDVAAELGKYEFVGAGFAALDEVEGKVASVTVADVNAAARKYFQVGKMLTVVAGTLPEGTPASQ